MLSTKGKKFPIKCIGYKCQEFLKCVFLTEAQRVNIYRETDGGQITS